MNFEPNYDVNGNFCGVIFTDDMFSPPVIKVVPNDIRNRDYIGFLAWNEANGNPIDVNGVAPFDLVSYKQQKLQSIATNTEALLASGFAYNGHNFALDAESRNRWTGMYAGVQFVTYPFTIYDVNGVAVSLSSRNEMDAWYGTGMARGAYILQGDASLKSQVANAADKAAVDAVVDNRS